MKRALDMRAPSQNTGLTVETLASSEFPKPTVEFFPNPKINPHGYFFNEAFGRICLVTNAQDQMELADILNVRPSNISQAQRSRTIPVSWLRTLLIVYSVLPLWILYEKGPQYISPETHLSNVKIDEILFKAENDPGIQEIESDAYMFDNQQIQNKDMIKDISYNFNNAFQRLLSITNSKHPIDLAYSLDLRPSDITDVQRVGIIPPQWLRLILKKFKILPSYILFGVDPQYATLEKINSEKKMEDIINESCAMLKYTIFNCMNT